MPANVIYNLIDECIAIFPCCHNVGQMCQLGGVSRSGYYAWRAATSKRQARKEKDEADFALIRLAYEYRGYAKGARAIHMRLLHLSPPVIMNVKKIRRLMKKYGLRCPFRKPNPYRMMAKALKTSTVAPNVVNRKFKAYAPRQVLLTDITYLPFQGSFCYLSTFLDACTHEILAYVLSPNLKVDIVLETVDRLIAKYGMQLDKSLIIHSDQGCHYTSHAFITKLRDNQFVQSMSRKGNCWDNAPQESFFGHMKDEIMRAVQKAKTFDEIKAIIDDWLDYYNNERYQWDLQKLSPCEYYQYNLTGVYPLPRGYVKPAFRGSAPDPAV